jgi:hypothetical protein
VPGLFTGDVGDPDEFAPDAWWISFDADLDENATYYSADHFVIPRAGWP